MRYVLLLIALTGCTKTYLGKCYYYGGEWAYVVEQEEGTMLLFPFKSGRVHLANKFDLKESDEYSCKLILANIKLMQ